MVRQLICAALLLIAVTTTLSAADVSGKWVAELQGRNGPQAITFRFKVDGNALSGTITRATGGDIPISDGKVEDDKITFNVVREANGNRLMQKYTGTVAGNEIRFTVEAQGAAGGGRGGPREFVAKRAE